MNKRIKKKPSAQNDDQNPVWFGLVQWGLIGFAFCLGFFPRFDVTVFGNAISSQYLAASAFLGVVCLGLLLRSFQTAALYAGAGKETEEDTPAQKN